MGYVVPSEVYDDILREIEYRLNSTESTEVYAELSSLKRQISEWADHDCPPED